MDLTFKKADVEDYEILIDINNKAYYDDYIIYGVCPGYNISIEKMRSSIEDKNIEKYLIYIQDKLVGVVSIKYEGDNNSMRLLK